MEEFHAAVGNGGPGVALFFVMKASPVRILVLLGAALCAAGCAMSTTTGPVGLASKTVSTLAGQAGVMGSANATGTAASFAFPAGAAVTTNGNLYVCDSFNSTIRQITPSGSVTTIAGKAGVPGYFDNLNYSGLPSYFNHPEGITTDGTNLYVADSGNGAIREIFLPGAAVTTLVSGFGNPLGVTYNGTDLYVADAWNSVIYQVTTGGAVSVVAGQAGVPGSSDGTGTAASFTFPEDVIAAGATTLYVVDTGNATIRKVTTAGVVTTIAGQVGVKGDVDATGVAAQFNWPEGIAIDGSGNLYVADTLNNVIRKVVISSGAVATLAGQGGVAGSANGTGDVATFNHPMKLVFDSATSSLYVGDTYNETIRRITPVP